MPTGSPDNLLDDLRAAAGDGAVSVDPADLFAYSRDLWPSLTVRVRDARETTPPLAVVRPHDEDEVLAVVRALTRHGVPVVPYGAGSGVCGGAAPLFGGVIVDLKRLDSLDPVDDGSLQVTCGPGMILQTLEERLNDEGYTLGHFPSSIFCASIGGCVAARGAGQLSSRYGTIEDMVTGLRVVTPELGVVATGSLDPSCVPPDWGPLFIGSEGTLGLITSIRLRVHPLPSAMVLKGVRMPSVGAGINAFREIMQSGLRPSVLRLYDPLDTWMAMQKGNDADGAGPRPRPGGGTPLQDGRPAAPEPPPVAPEPEPDRGLAEGLLRRFRGRGRRHRSAESEGLFSGIKEKLLADRLKDLMKPENLPVERLLANPGLLNKTIGLLPGRCLAIIGCEGEPAAAAEQLEAAMSVAHRLGGQDLGAGPGEQWFRTRYHVSFKLPKLLAGGGFADTMETAAPWTRVEDLYDAVRAAVAPHVLVMAHLSHAYHEGCSIYFTLVGYDPDPDRAAELYRRTWDAALQAAHSVGATITHHHGVGVLKKDFMDAEHGDGRQLFEASRDAIDPGRHLNSGKLFPDEVPDPGPVVDDPEPKALVIHDHVDGVVEASVDWRGVDLAAELELRGHFLPPLGRDFLESTVGEWLSSGAIAAHTAVHGAWDYPLLAVEGRLPDGRAWRSGRLPRSAAGPSWLPFGQTDSGPARVVSATFRTLTPPPLRPVGFRFDHMDRAAVALGKALRGGPSPLAGMVFAGSDSQAWRTVLQDAKRAREGGIVYLAFVDPDGFPSGSQRIVDRLAAAGGELIDDDDSLGWWEDHWAFPCREGQEAMDRSGPEASEQEFGRVAAVTSWKKAVLLLRAVETLTGGSARAAGWIDAPLETGCTVRWRLSTTKKGTEEASLVPHQVEATIRTFGARLANVRWEGVAERPEYVFEGRVPQSDSQRIADAIGRNLRGDA